jgi:hypothetical protein
MTNEARAVAEAQEGGTMPAGKAGNAVLTQAEDHSVCWTQRLIMRSMKAVQWLPAAVVTLSCPQYQVHAGI